jgi:GIY-YIG catalytic domain.
MKEKNCGIYAIINIINQKLYIGSSKDLKYRKRKHFEGLRYNRHPNNYLQQSFNKYGEKSFDFKVIEYCKESKLLEREQYYINYYQSCNRNCGFNLSLKAGRIVLTEEGREKMRQSHLGKKQSLETIEKRALKLRGKKTI